MFGLWLVESFSTNHWDQICHNQIYMMSPEPCFQFAIIRLTNPMCKQMHKQNMTFAAAVLACCKGQMGIWLDWPRTAMFLWTLYSVSIPESWANTEQFRSAGHKTQEICTHINVYRETEDIDSHSQGFRCFCWLISWWWEIKLYMVWCLMILYVSLLVAACHFH